ncbi:MAG: hypothetical protein ABJE66_10235 [Deltaproteobacteria bacterium]
MRRAACRGLVLASWVLAHGHAHAAPWTVTGEAGAEVDSNVERVETGPGLDTAPVTSPVMRLGVRADKKDELFGGGYALHLSDLTRIAGDRDISVEDVSLLAADLRWVHPLADRPVAAGFALSAIDAFPLDDDYGARTFRNLGADLVINAHDGEDYRLNLAFGARQFKYKPPTVPSHLFDWSGPAANARLDLTLWQPSGRTRSLELAATTGFELQGYESRAFVNACSPSSPPNPACTAPTDLARRDRAARAGLELTYVGSFITSLGYQLTVIDSNSFGQSFARHRVLASGTMSIGKNFISLLAILQIDQYLDGLLVQADVVHQEFTNIEDENRSSAQVHVARKLTDEWSLEVRAAYWRNILGNTMDLAFSRTLVYAGVVYNK